MGEKRENGECVNDTSVWLEAWISIWVWSPDVSVFRISLYQCWFRYVIMEVVHIFFSTAKLLLNCNWLNWISFLVKIRRLSQLIIRVFSSLSCRETVYPTSQSLSRLRTLVVTQRQWDFMHRWILNSYNIIIGVVIIKTLRN